MRPPRPDTRRLDFARALVVRAVVLVGLAALSLAGASGPSFALTGIAGVGFGWAMSGRPANARIWQALSVVALVATVGLPLAAGVRWNLVGMGLLVFLQVQSARLWSRPGDDRPALLFAVMMCLIACTESRSHWLGPALLGLSGLLVPALALVFMVEVEEAGGRRRDPLAAGGRRTALLLAGPLTTALTVLLFVFIPRLDAEVLAELARGEEVTGFDEQVELGELGEIKDNPELVMRVTVTDHQGRSLPGPFYFRGVALDHFDGNRWTATDPGFREQRVLQPGSLGVLREGELLQEMLVEPLGSAPLFGIPVVRRIAADDLLYADGRGGLRFDQQWRRRELSVVSNPDAPLVDGTDPRMALQLPAELDPRIGALADEATLGLDAPMAKAAALESWLASRYDYTLIPSGSVVGQPLSDFLFESRQGHCEYFATALAVMLRVEGVPARIVNGFYGGDLNPLGGHLMVRQAHAHSWVEAFIEGAWVRLDATPAGEAAVMAPAFGEQLSDALLARWQGWVLDYDLDSQISGVRRVGAELAGAAGVAPQGGPVARPGLLSWVLVAGLAGVVGMILWRLGRRVRAAGVKVRQRSGVAGVHARARKQVARKGYSVPLALPPVAAAEWLVAEVGEPAQPLVELAWLHYRVRYGQEEEAALVEQARIHLTSLRDLPTASSRD